MNPAADDEREGRDLWKRWREGPPGAESTPCPDPNDLAAYLDGRAPEGLAREIEEHLSSCDSCLDALMELRALLRERPMDVPARVRERARGVAAERSGRAEAVAVSFRARQTAAFDLLRASAGWAMAACLIVVACAAGAALGEGTILNRLSIASAAISESILDVPGAGGPAPGILNGGL